jgi:hypothetical protein
MNDNKKLVDDNMLIEELRNFIFEEQKQKQEQENRNKYYQDCDDDNNDNNDKISTLVSKNLMI